MRHGLDTHASPRLRTLVVGGRLRGHDGVSVAAAVQVWWAGDTGKEFKQNAEVLAWYCIHRTNSC